MKKVLRGGGTHPLCQMLLSHVRGGPRPLDLETWSSSVTTERRSGVWKGKDKVTRQYIEKGVARHELETGNKSKSFEEFRAQRSKYIFGAVAGKKNGVERQFVYTSEESFF